MTPFRLSISELRRLTTGTMPRLAILAMAIIPTLYAGLYLFANHDPYGRLAEVPAAVVVEDEGATTTDATSGKETHVRYGAEVADQLQDDGGFDWTETDRQHAEDGVRDGTYDAALIVGPDFSADLVSSGELDPHQASLQLVTNDANNYLATTIANTIVGEVRDSVASQVGTEAASTFLAGFHDIHTDLSDAVDGAARLADGARTLQDGIGTADDGAHDLADGAGTAAEGAARLSSGAQDLDDGAGRLASGASDAADGASRLHDGADDLADGAGTLSSGLGTLREGTKDLPGQTQELADGAAQVADGNAQVAQYGDEAAQGVDELGDRFDAWRADASTTLADQGLSQDQIDALLADLDDARAPLDAAGDQVKDASTQLDTLSSGAQQVSDGAARLADAAPALAQGVDDAADGAATLDDGASDLADGAGTLDSGASDLADGAASLHDATGTLATGAGSLADGTATLSSGAARLASGTSDLADGSDDLVDGATRLHAGLADGLGQVPDPDQKTADATASNLGDPVAVHSDDLSSAGTYGAGLAPFFLSLATWIGAYVLFLLVRPLSTRALAAGRPSWMVAVGGWLTPFLLGVAQVTVMFLVTTLALGIDVAHPWLTLGFLVLVTAAFMAIVQALNAWLGAAGQFLGLVLMLVQLVTAGGTFPWQTLPEPLRSIHYLLPMTYGVEGLRQLLYGGSLAAAGADALVLGGVLVVALGFTTWAARRQRVWTATRLQPELVL
ncbi:YhgE/Pip domain-containing protein [Cellulomonas sp. PhB143]|uniref:YhgE/Pip domain-containing protein n=1 Tax=Cellulomonas sp. PhB143 TaxID=2485186 RepID=UPI000F49C452|nr:YhgE/Pip domain-containing protein [Cellulomonas sp. PhB143]ROS78847.1 putative membrane protein [Cellulomonas sp. PhB143]